VTADGPGKAQAPSQAGGTQGWQRRRPWAAEAAASACVGRAAVRLRPAPGGLPEAIVTVTVTVRAAGPGSDLDLRPQRQLSLRSC
jgi:hypothetical protein